MVWLIKNTCGMAVHPGVGRVLLRASPDSTCCISADCHGSLGPLGTSPTSCIQNKSSSSARCPVSSQLLCGALEGPEGLPVLPHICYIGVRELRKGLVTVCCEVHAIPRPLEMWWMHMRYVQNMYMQKAWRTEHACVSHLQGCFQAPRHTR